MSKRLDILKKSLIKKEDKFNNKLQDHFDTVKRANGQPLNDKRNGQATLNKWDRQNESLRNLKDSIQKTKDAIEKEEFLNNYVNKSNEEIPNEILDLVEKGELNQWRRYPNTFFVQGVEGARIVWDKKRNVVAHKFLKSITVQEDWSKFVKVYNHLHSILNK